MSPSSSPSLATRAISNLVQPLQLLPTASVLCSPLYSVKMALTYFSDYRVLVLCIHKQSDTQMDKNKSTFSRNTICHIFLSTQIINIHAKVITAVTANSNSPGVSNSGKDISKELPFCLTDLSL